MGDLVQVYLYRVARLCRAMTALGTAGGLISKQAHAFEFITGQLVCHRLQHSGIVGRCYAIRAIRAAIEKRTEVHSRQRTIAFHACFNPHFYGVASPVQQKYFFACAGDLDGSTCTPRQFAGTDLVGKRIRLAAKTPTDIGRDHPDMRLRQLQHLT